MLDRPVTVDIVLGAEALHLVMVANQRCGELSRQLLGRPGIVRVEPSWHIGPSDPGGVVSLYVEAELSRSAVVITWALSVWWSTSWEIDATLLRNETSEQEVLADLWRGTATDIEQLGVEMHGAVGLIERSVVAFDPAVW